MALHIVIVSHRLLLQCGQSFFASWVIYQNPSLLHQSHQNQRSAADVDQLCKHQSFLIQENSGEGLAKKIHSTLGRKPERLPTDDEGSSEVVDHSNVTTIAIYVIYHNFQVSPNEAAEDKKTVSLHKKLASMTLMKKSKILQVPADIYDVNYLL